jgi:hypothetical protein
LWALLINNAIQILEMEFPQHEWLPWKFTRVQTSFWDDPKVRRRFFDWLGKQLNILKMEDWYPVKATQIRDFGGAGLLASVFGDSVAPAVMSVFPEHSWQFWRFQKVPKGMWEDPKRQREFLEFAATELGIKTMEDWYNVTSAQLQHLGGAALILHIYKVSVVDLVTSVYPEHRWMRWKFVRMGQRDWQDLNLQREYLSWAYNELKLKSLDDWYSVSKKQIISLHGAALLRRYDQSLSQALSLAYPDHVWDHDKFKRR